MAAGPANPILLYDGVCGLCNRFVQFVLKRDARDQFRFASLQSDFAATILRRHGRDPRDLDTLYLVTGYEQPNEQVAARSDAVISILRQLGGFWGTLAAALQVLPRWLRDWKYSLIARIRYRAFGKYEACPLPEQKHRHKFLDM
jgi:predicted DCC family thiol-disulfide oxidoreductase YuxK